MSATGSAPAVPDGIGSNSRLNLSYEVRRFDANNLTLEVHNNSGRGGWLMYSDVWNPGWSAKVNGNSVSVRCADLAYKAVPIVAGENWVEFHFAIPWFSLVAGLFAVNAAAWVIALAWMSWRIVRPK